VGWRLLGAQESSLIYGRGNPNVHGDQNNTPCTSRCPGGCAPGTGGDGGGGGGDGGGGGGGNRPVRNPNLPDANSFWGNDNEATCSTCAGMPVWRVSEPDINLWIEDQPLAYRPALGPRISLLMGYKQRDEHAGDMGFFNFGSGWDCSWLSYVERQTTTLSAD